MMMRRAINAAAYSASCSVARAALSSAGRAGSLRVNSCLTAAPMRTITTTAATASNTTATTTTVFPPPSRPSVSVVCGSVVTAGLEAVSAFITSDALATLRASGESTVSVESILGAKCSAFAPTATVVVDALQDFKGDAGEAVWLYPAGSADGSSPRLLLVGLGSARDTTLATYRSATWKAISSFQSRLLTRVGVVLPVPSSSSASVGSSSSSPSRLDVAAEVSRVSLLSEHHFRRHLSASEVDKRQKRPMTRLDLIDPRLDSNSEAEEAARVETVAAQTVIADATILAREWANERGDVATPAFIEAEARVVAEKAGLRLRVLQEAELEREGLHLLRAVGQAGAHKARLVLLEYRGDDSSSETTALVGKGVTFDTGGLLIKGRGNMEGMHLDMSGAATVLGVMAALPRLGVRANVVGVLALAENATSHDSYKPLAILPSVAGTVEVTDTDAEGRLALADAITFVQRAHNPTRIVDLATLTGAAVVALGEHTAAVFSNNDRLATDLLASADRVGEAAWRMPLAKLYADELKATYADFKNCASHRWGGACIAAAFLEKFVDSGVHWAHIDLAGPAMASKPKEWICEGGTGYGTQTLLQYFLAQQKAKESQ